MTTLTVSELIPILQVAIGPMVFVSGIGLLLLVMTNRLGRVIDRGRSLVRERPKLPENERARVEVQLGILTRRARLIRTAIIMAALSVLIAAILVIVLFFTAVLDLNLGWLIAALFIAAMGALIASLTAFIQDLNQSLTAFTFDIGKWPEERD